MPRYQKGTTGVHFLERRFVFTLVIVLFLFAASLISIIPSRLPELGRWVGMSGCIIFGFNWKKSIHSLFSGKIDILIILLLTFYLASSLVSVSIQKSLLYLAVCVLQIVLFTLLTRHLKYDSWLLIYDFLVALCVLVSWMGVGGYISSPEKYVVQGRLAGLSSANSMALIAMLGIISSFVQYLFLGSRGTQPDRVWRLFYLLGGIGCLVALVLTGSRGSLGGMLSGVIVVLFFSGKFSRIIPILLALIPLAPVLNDFIADSGLDKTVASAYVRSDTDDMLYSRRAVWDQSIQYFYENPWLGKGYAVHDASGSFVDGSGYFGLLASVGVIATGLFLLIAALIVVRLYRLGSRLHRHTNMPPGNRHLMALGGGCLVALLVQGVGEPWMLGPGSFIHVIYWLSVGACIAATSVPQTSSQGVSPFNKPRVRLRPARFRPAGRCQVLGIGKGFRPVGPNNPSDG